MDILSSTGVVSISCVHFDIVGVRFDMFGVARLASPRQRPRELLGWEFQYNVSFDGDDEARAVMAKRAGGRRTLPQIFIGKNYHVGGCDDLYSLEGEGELDDLLGI